MRPFDFINNAIRNDRELDDFIRILEKDRIIRDNRDLDSKIEVAIEVANDIDEYVRPNVSYENILLSSFIALLVKDAEDARLPQRDIPRKFEDIAREIDRMYSDALREKDRDRDRGRRDDRYRRDDRHEDRRGGGQYIEPDRRGGSDNDYIESRGMGKGRNRRRKQEESRKNDSRYVGRNDDHIIEEEKAAVPAVTTVIDTSRFKVERGTILENYEEHELSRVYKFSKSNIEVARQELFKEHAEAKGDHRLIKADTISDFIGGTEDKAIVVGLISKSVDFSGMLGSDNKESIIHVLEANVSETDGIRRVNRILSALEEHNKLSAPTRMYRYINDTALKCLAVAFNMYAKVNATFDGEFLSEWKETEELIKTNTDIMDPMHVDEFRVVLAGLLNNMIIIKSTDNESKLKVISNAFASKVEGAFVIKSDIVGEDYLATITRDKNPEAETAITTTLDIRDKLVGDAWSTAGIMPVIVSDSLGAFMVVYATKSSDEKYTINNWKTGMSSKW